MTFLYVLLGIIAFFVLLFSVKFKVSIAYCDDFFLDVKWGIFKFKVFPAKEDKKPKKEKKEKKKKEEKPKEEKEEQEKEKKSNPFKNFYDNQGVSGVINLAGECARALGRMGKSFCNALLIEKLYLRIDVAGKDAADTAVKYGKITAAIYPSLSFISSHVRIKDKYIQIMPAYLTNKSWAGFEADISLRPVKLTIPLFMLIARLVKQLFRVILAKPVKAEPVKEKGGN